MRPCPRPEAPGSRAGTRWRAGDGGSGNRGPSPAPRRRPGRPPRSRRFPSRSWCRRPGPASAAGSLSPPAVPCRPALGIKSRPSMPTAAAVPQTPAMQQYQRMKAEHPDALLFFRMGDFYEMFFDDALVAAKALEIALTSRSKDKEGEPIPMCGVPHHAAPGYIARLVKLGHRVALCEQIEDPRQAKGVVKREVVRVITPATQLEAEALVDSETSFVMAIDAAGSSVGAAFLEPTTGEFFVSQWDGHDRFDRLRDEMQATRPREVVLAGGQEWPPFLDDPTAPESSLPRSTADGPIDPGNARRDLLGHFGVVTLEAFGCERLPRATAAAAAALRYVKATQKRDL